ncbi:MAG: putative glycosidase [Ilumatobacteraceae bacterium]|nr:putative glycosidase [Ilumatobacteraceae bacterium]
MAEPIPSKRRAQITIATAAAAIAAIVLGGLAWSRAEPWQRTGPPITVSGWAPYWQPDAALASFQANSELFSDVSVLAFSAVAGDSIVPYGQLQPDMIATYRAATTERNVPMVATIVDDSPSGTMAAVLADPARRAAHVQLIVSLVIDQGFDGVDLDYEKFAFSDDRSTWATTRPNWIAFLTELSAALHAQSKLLIVSVPPIYDGGQTGDSGYWVYDPAAMAPLVDRIRIMTYDYSYQGGDPGPIAPIKWVQSVIDAVTDVVPPAKVDLGIPTYGYDWVLSVAGTCPVDQTPETEPISTDRAARETAQRGITPVWNQTTAEMSYQYTDTLTGTDANGAATTCTVNRIVHYLDAEAIHRRAYLAHRNDLHGVALWALGNDDELTWDGLRAARLGEETWPAATP